MKTKNLYTIEMPVVFDLETDAIRKCLVTFEMESQMPNNANYETVIHEVNDFKNGIIFYEDDFEEECLAEIKEYCYAWINENYPHELGKGEL